MLSILIQSLQQNTAPAQAASMAAYMRNQFPYLGIKAPLREQIVKDWLKAQQPPSEQELLAWITTLYDLPEREYQYAACDLIKFRLKKVEPEFWLPKIAEFITNKSWWDTVDVWAPKITAGLLKRAPKFWQDYPDQWIHHDNFWLQRSAIIAQINYRREMDLERIFRYCKLRADSTEFFVQKAIGWALRSASRYFPEPTLAFLKKEQSQLAPLSLREGSKLLKKNGLWS